MTRPENATTSQLELIGQLLRRAGCYDLKTVTVMHRRLHVPEHLIGKPVELWLGGLTKPEASRVITALQEQV